MNQQPSIIISHFQYITDFRIERTKKHKLIDIIFIALCAMICGYDSWDEMELFAKAKIDWFKKYLDLPNGIPSHDTIRRVFMYIDPKAFEQCFIQWIQQLNISTQGKIVAIDGKTLKGSHNRCKGKKAIHMVNAWLCENECVIGQYKVSEKSNEITAIPELLDNLILTGSTVTIDAMGCQTAIAKKIVDAGANYVFGLKGNQGALREEVEDLFSEIERTDFYKDEYDSSNNIDGDHGRIDIRECFAISSHHIELSNKWEGIKSVAMIKSQRHVAGKVSNEKRYYISSLEVDAEKISHTIRSHWHVENSLHWCLDIGFQEDSCRIRAGYAAQNLAVIRQMALNFIKSNKTKKGGIIRQRKLAALDNQYLETLLSD